VWLETRFLKINIKSEEVLHLFNDSVVQDGLTDHSEVGSQHKQDGAQHQRQKYRQGPSIHGTETTTPILKVSH